MTNLKDYQAASQTCSLFKGAPGTGKTVAAGSYPKVYFISTDGKVASLKKFYPARDDIYFDIFGDFWSVFQRLEKLQEDCQYKTVVLDGLTKLSLFSMFHSMKYREVERAKAKDRDKDPRGTHRGDLILPEIEDYNAESVGLYQCIFKLKDIGVRFSANIILIAHVLDIEYEELGGKKRRTQTLLTGGKKLAAGLPGEFDEIYHFELGAAFTSDSLAGYKVKTQGNEDKFARTALPLPAEIDITNRNDFYSILMEYVNKNQTKEIKNADKIHDNT